MSTTIGDAVALKRINTMRTRAATWWRDRPAPAADEPGTCTCPLCQARRSGQAGLKALFAAIGDDMSDGDIQAIDRGPGVH